MKYIKPTPLKGYGLLMALNLGLIVLTGSYFFYYIFMILVVTIALMYLIVLKNSKRVLQYLVISDDEVTVGDKIKVDVKSNNTSIFPVAHAKIECKIYNNHNHITYPSENVFFNPFQIINIRENFEVKTRGFFTTGLIHTEYSDPLRIFKKSRHVEKQIELIVYPRVVDLDYFYMPNTGYIGTRAVANSGHADFSSLKKVRKYTHSDSYKKIHWKLSSKRNELFVKEYEATSSTKLTLFLDAFETHYLNDIDRVMEDKAVEVAASVIKYALKSNADATMVFHNQKFVQVESRDLSTYPTVLQELVTFVAKGGMAFSELLSQETKRLEQGSFVVLVTTVITEALINTLIGLKRRSFEISLVLLTPNEDTSREMLRGMGIHVYTIHPDDNLKEKLEAFQ